MALVTGKVTGKNGSVTVINAEPAGTSDLVSPIKPFNIGSDGTYSLYVPALPGGTAYDFYVSAPDRDFALANDVIVKPLVQNQAQNFTISTHSRTQVKGGLVDACNGGLPAGLQNATLKILEAVVIANADPC